jgi:hypothetical protein
MNVPDEIELNSALVGLPVNTARATISLYGGDQTLDVRVVTPWPGPYADDGSYKIRRITLWIDRALHVMRAYYR